MVNNNFCRTCYYNSFIYHDFHTLYLKKSGTQNNFGISYRTLTEVRDKGENTQNAISANQKALEIYTLEKYPDDYASTQNSLENAKRLLI